MLRTSEQDHQTFAEVRGASTKIRTIGIVLGVLTLASEWIFMLMFQRLLEIPVNSNESWVVKALMLSGVQLQPLMLASVVVGTLYALGDGFKDMIALKWATNVGTNARLMILHSKLAMGKHGKCKDDSGSNEDIVNLCTLPVENIEHYLKHTEFPLAEALTQLILAVLIVGLLDWRILGVIVLAIAIGNSLTVFLQYKVLGSELSKFAKKKSNIMSKLQDFLAGIELVKMAGMGSREYQEFKQHANEACHVPYNLQAGVYGIGFTTPFITSSLPVGIALILQNNISLEDASVYLIIYALIARIHAAYLTFGMHFAKRVEYTNALAILKSAFSDAADENVEKDDATNTQTNVNVFARTTDEEMGIVIDPKTGKQQKPSAYFGNEILLSEIVCGYRNIQEESPKVILNDINLIARQGDVIGVVGGTGQGKSTFIKTVMGVLSPLSGEIIVDGISLTPSDKEMWAGSTVSVPQNCFLFGRTLRKNFTYGINRSVTDKEIFEAAKYGMATDIIQNSPLGLDTVLDVGGTVLSGGERQRVHLTRVFISEAKVIFLDEPTSALDLSTQGVFLKNLKHMIMSEEKLCFLITHQLKVLEVCNRILRVENGKVVQSMEE